MIEIIYPNYTTLEMITLKQEYSLLHTRESAKLLLQNRRALKEYKDAMKALDELIQCYVISDTLKKYNNPANVSFRFKEKYSSKACVFVPKANSIVIAAQEGVYEYPMNDKLRACVTDGSSNVRNVLDLRKLDEFVEKVKDEHPYSEDDIEYLKQVQVGEKSNES